jgi:uncharacterized protein GlcG (DUF336 family)
MNTRLFVVLSVFVLTLGWPPIPVTAQGLPVEKILPLPLATEAALAALSSCEKQGYRVSVAVVDRSGLVRSLIRADWAGPHTLDSSRRKAYTAASLGRSTAELAGIVAGNPANEGLRDMNEDILILAGGLPIRAGDEVVGGIGVGGAPGGEKDAACAQAGLDKIKDRLK